MTEARKLFLDLKDRIKTKVVTEEEVRPFSVEELLEATDRIRNRKA